MNKRMWLTGFAGLFGVLPVLAQEKGVTSNTGTREESLPDFSVSSREAANLLRQRVASVNWKDATFEEVLDWVKTQGEGRVNVVPKWGPLNIQSVSPERSVTLQLNNTTIADVLKEVTDQLSETGDIQYRAIGNKLTVSTKQDFERTMYLRVYDVGDLLFRIESFGPEAPKIDLQKTNRSGSGGGGSVFTGASGSSGQQQDTERLERENEEGLIKLRHIIEQTIAPESWDLGGGEGGSIGASQTARDGGGHGRIRVLNTSLIVLNTLEVHEMIAGGR
jgi:hypothetical protein